MSKNNRIKSFFTENAIIKGLKNDVAFKENMSLYLALVFSLAFSVLMLGLGIYHSSFWFYSLAGYYILLSILRAFILHYMRTNTLGEDIYKENIKACVCGAVLLVISLALALITFFMVYFGRSFTHHEITTIAIATYTFSSFTIAIINLVKYKSLKNSPLLFASRAVSLASACVSMLTLTATMLTTFGGGEQGMFERTMVLSTGIAVIGFVIVIAAIMIYKSIKQIRLHKKQSLEE